MAEKLHMKNGGTPVDQLRQEHERQSALFDAQPPIVQRFLEAQARQIADAYIERTHSVRFTLPDRVTVPEKTEPLPVPQAAREQRVGTFGDRIAKRDVHETLRRRLAELEQSSDKAVAVSAGLIRYAAATHMVRNMLPSGQAVLLLLR